MNDAERDAWLREALRHAPDVDAAPPRGVSEAILLKARAAARGATPRRGTSRDASAHPLMAWWDWLARPPVAAGFASVMAATLVGLMWWDRPMDEAMPRSPARVSDRAPAAPSPAPTPSAAADTSPLASTAPTLAATPPASRQEAIVVAPSVPDPRPMNATENKAAVDDGTVRRRQRSAPEQVGAAEAARAEPAATPAPRSVDSLAKERAPTAEKKNEAPAPFPSAEMQRERPTPRPSLDTAAPSDARKKDVEASRSQAAAELERAATPPAARPVAPPVESAVAAKAKSAAATPPVPAPPAADTPPAAMTAPPAAVTAAPARDRADAQRLQQRQGAFGGLREQDAAGSAPSPLPSAPPAPFRNELRSGGSQALARSDAAARAVAPRLFAAIAAEPERWLRQTAGGGAVPLDTGWRAWLAELDAAAAGRWQPLGVAAPAEGAAARDDATTVRLVNGGRVAAIVRLDGVTVHVDAAPGTGADRWQAALGPAGVEQLRRSARRLSP